MGMGRDSFSSRSRWFVVNMVLPLGSLCRLGLELIGDVRGESMEKSNLFFPVPSIIAAAFGVTDGTSLRVARDGARALGDGLNPSRLLSRAIVGIASVRLDP